MMRRAFLADSEMLCGIDAHPSTPLPAQALTASCSAEERARCREAGMLDLIPKPIRIEMLKAVLRQYAGECGAVT